MSQRSKTNRKINKSSDHGECYCYACEVEKDSQYIKKKEKSEWSKCLDGSTVIHLKSGSKFLYFTEAQIKTINNPEFDN